MKLSIIIPSYNVEKTIENCLNSVINQIIPNIEIITVDDGSRDSTLQILKCYEEKYSYIKVIHQDNQGVSVARNTGMNYASGKWIMFLDGDDQLQPDSLNKLNLEVEEDGIIYGYSTRILTDQDQSCNSFVVDTEKIKMALLSLPNNIKVFNGSKIIDSLNNWTCWGKLFRKEIIEKNHIIFPKGITHGEDLCFLYEYYNHSRKFRLFEYTVYYYYVNQESVSHRFNPFRIENTNKLISKIKNIDDSIENTKDYHLFVYDRLYACCLQYFSSINQNENKKEKKQKLHELCTMEEYKNALQDREFYSLSLGKATRCKKWIIKKLLLHRMYGLVISILNT